MTSFFAELKKRKIYRVAAVYVVTAWVIVQIASQVLPPFDVPRWVLSALVILLALGFPFVLVMAWAFDLKPDSSETETTTWAAGDTARYRGFLVVGGIAVAAGLAFAYWKLGPTTHGIRRGESKSVAVLPFESLSEDKENTYFANGIQEEILTRLTKIGALKVISRSSTQPYGSRPANLAEVAKQLGVTHLVEGTVQKSGEQVRINVQLIEARTDSHVWAESFDRKLTDLFGVESEVAEKIAASLKAELTGEEHRALAIKPTINPAAYDAFLRGLAYERTAAVEPDTFQNAVRFYNEAVKADPAFAVAWAHLAAMHSDMYHFGFDHTPARLAAMKAAAETAMRLQPNLGESHSAWGFYLYRGVKDYAAAEQAFQRAHELLPNDAWSLSAVAFVNRRQGKWEEALRILEKVAQLDPRNAQLHSEWGYTLLFTRHFARAREVAERGLAIAPGDSTLSALNATIHQAEGDLAGAERALASLSLQPTNTTVFNTQMSQLLMQRRFAPAITALSTALQFPDVSLGDQIGEFYVMLSLARRATNDEAAARETCTKGIAFLEGKRAEGADTWYLSACLGLLKAHLGDEAGALREGEHALVLTGPVVSAKPDVEEAIARMNARLGRTDAALNQLPRLLKASYQKSFYGSVLTPALLRIDPAWDNLRADPRFQKLAETGTP